MAYDNREAIGNYAYENREAIGNYAYEHRDQIASAAYENQDFIKDVGKGVAESHKNETGQDYTQYPDQYYQAAQSYAANSYGGKG